MHYVRSKRSSGQGRWRLSVRQATSMQAGVLVVMVCCSDASAALPLQRPALQPAATHNRIQTLLHSPPCAALADVSGLHPDADPICKQKITCRDMACTISLHARNSPLHRLRGGAHMRTGKRTFQRYLGRTSHAWYCLGVAMLGHFGLLWPRDWKRSDSIEFAVLSLILLSLDAMVYAFIH